ncbi:hypothetical protein [Proteiniphilum acetatigenes]|nr:hypothetical protein [Proteiniphilum acetatigenes]
MNDIIHYKGRHPPVADGKQVWNEAEKEGCRHETSQSYSSVG